jgi:hypothetical protein
MSRNRPDEDHSDPYVPDENDPDYRFSEAAGYAGHEPPKRNWGKPILIGISLFMLATMVLPMLLDILTRPVR